MTRKERQSKPKVAWKHEQAGKALRRLIREYGESITLGNALRKVYGKMPKAWQVPLNPAKKSKATKKSNRKPAAAAPSQE